jgi:hypothetical protein
MVVEVNVGVEEEVTMIFADDLCSKLIEVSSE